MKARASIRLRLTVVYTVVLVGTCAALLGLNYAMLYSSLYGPVEESATSVKAAAAGPVRAGDALKDAMLDQLRTQTLLHTAGTSAIALAVTAVVGLGLSWFVAGRMLRPLRTLTAATRRISHDRLHERIALAGPRDELKELADTFDDMVARLEAAFTSQRRFVADASHELRTPLTIVRTGAEVLLAKQDTTVEQWQAMTHRTLTATGRAERLLDALLALARSDSGVLSAEPHDLAELAAVAVAEADDETMDMTTDLRSAPVIGDPILLDRLIRNLVDNAIRHNHPGGAVSVRSAAADGRSTVTVTNTGSVIPVDEVSRLFEPFQRLDPGRAAADRSVGLGLAIVRSIVRAHGGIVAAIPRPGGGLTVTVTFTAAGGE
ncbi:ATP-binding protein [Asanoa sp. NPDC049573]|uniref:ATP-binding protein n=1 Tax=Asanoa sp. NPDC049573 TaxID=3155396 RepID=UPI003425159E